MNPLLRFMYKEFEIRVIKGGKGPWFVIRDLCGVLGFPNYALAFSSLEDHQKSVEFAYSEGGRHRFFSVNESGLGALLACRPNPDFALWVVNQVIPQVEKYQPDLPVYPNLLQDYLDTVQALVETQKDRDRLQRQVQLQSVRQVAKHEEPADVEAFTCNQVAKTLRLGRNRLFVLLRNRGYLMKDNLPYQRYIDAGYFRVKIGHVSRNDGSLRRYTQTLITEKGVQLIRRVLQSERELVTAQ